VKDHQLQGVFLIPGILTLFFFFWQISTTKGTGGDVIILEEAAYIDPGFFYVSARPCREFQVVF